MKRLLTCPSCGNHRLKLKYEVVFSYAYLLDEDAPGLKNGAVFYPYLYDERVQKFGEQYIECEACKKRYPCFFQDAGAAAGQIQKILDKAE